MPRTAQSDNCFLKMVDLVKYEFFNRTHTVANPPYGFDCHRRSHRNLAPIYCISAACCY